MKFFIVYAISLFCIVTGLYLKAMDERDHVIYQTEYCEASVYNDAVDNLTNSNDILDVVNLKGDIKNMVELKNAVYYFKKAEDILMEAKKLQSALGEENIVPFAEQRLNEAMSFYDVAKEIIDRLPEIDKRHDYNFLLNYTKGEIYHRFMMLSSKIRPEDSFRQALVFYKKSLDYKSNDLSTVINIELLLKNANDNQGKTNNKTKLLNQMPKFSIGASTGN